MFNVKELNLNNYYLFVDFLEFNKLYAIFVKIKSVRY